MFVVAVVAVGDASDSIVVDGITSQHNPDETLTEYVRMMRVT